VNPEKYEKFIHYKKVKRVLFAKLKKALYGTLQAALIFWKDLTRVLESWGFELNPSDNCMANAQINGSQCTVLWHVDDLKISHLDPNVVSNIIPKLNERYGREVPLTERHKKVHQYLGMTIDYSTQGKVMFRIDGYVQDILSQAWDNKAMSRNAVDLAAEYLFAMNNDNSPTNSARRMLTNSTSWWPRCCFSQKGLSLISRRQSPS
jgi:hypothetical protein